MTKKVMEYVALTAKVVIVMIGIPFIGDFIVNKVFHLNLDWAYSILLVLSALLVIEIIGSTFSWANVWGRTRDARSKIRAITFLVVFLLIAYFPVSQGIQERWINSLFFVVALLMVIPFWWIERRNKDKLA